MGKPEFTAAVQAWWDADYSWPGLARKSVSMDGATVGLDEVFAMFADSLVEFDSRLWTPLHLPWFTPDASSPDAPVGRGAAVTQWLRGRPNTSRGVCLSGIISPVGINLPRGTGGPLVADQTLLGGGLSLADVNALRITRSRIDGNLRARRCTFIQDVTLFETEVTGAIDLADCTFERIIDMRRCEAGGRIELSNGRLQGYAAMIEDTRAASGLALEGATAAGDIVLCGSEFGANVTLERAIIGGDVRAGGATFQGGLSLANATLVGNLDLHCAALNGPLSIEATRIDGRISARGAPHQPLAGLAAHGAILGGQADFSGRAFTQSIDCSAVQFAAPPLMHGCTMHPDVSFAGAGFADVPRQRRVEITKKRTGWRALGGSWLPLVWTTPPAERKAYDLECERLGSAYRTLRLAAAAISNVEYESRFHILELRMRQARTDVPILEQATSRAYDVLTACGTSLTRPVATIIAVPFVATVALFMLFASFVRLDDVPALLRFSLRQMAPPPTVWTAGDLALSGPPITDIAREWPAPLLIVGTLVFVVTAAMLAILLVALQRRFRQ